MLHLVTGGAGFIGSAIARRLLADGHEVRVFDSLVTGRRDAVPEGAEFVQEDLLDVEALKAACEGVDIVFHQAAIRSVPKSVDDPVRSNEANVSGTLNLLMAASDAGVRRVVYASSSSVYGDQTEGVATTDLAPDPRSPYAVSKLAGELYCRVWTALGRIPTVSLRYFNVYGPGQHPESKYAAVFPAFVSSLLSGRAPEIHWDGEQVRDFTYIDDVVEANIRAASAPEEAEGGVFNVGSDSPKSINHVLKRVSEELGDWIDPTFLPKRSGDVRRTHADISRSREVLGWQPQVDFDEGVKRTVGWFQSADAGSV